MRPFLVSIALLTLVAGPLPAAADPIRLVAADDRGVTLRLDLARFDYRPASNGRFELVAAGCQVMDVPGRPRVPYAGVLLALPPGAQARASVIGGDIEEVSAVRLTLGDRPLFREDPGVRGLVPAREPVPAVLDGAWPTSPVEVGEPFTLRRQRVVAVTLRPFRCDEATGRLWTRRSLTVRVDFVGGEGSGRVALAAEDRHWDPVLREGLLNYEQARSWRLAPTPATRRDVLGAAERRTGPAGAMAAMAFDEDFPEVRVKVDSTGIYHLGYGDLSPLGYPTNIPIAQVSVHRHEFVESTTPPYVTVELPIEVEDQNANGLFDASDRIVVFVQSWAERSRASTAQRAWGDAEVVYATAVSGTGLRMGSRPGWRNVAGLTPLTSYPWKQRWEKNLKYFLFPLDTLGDAFHWTEIAVYYDRDDTLRFETNHLDTTRAVTVSVSWMGRRDGNHYSWAQYRNGPGAPFITVADSLAWFGRGAQTATVSYPGSTLGEGNVNRVRVWGKRSAGPPQPLLNDSDNVGVNFIEATYWRGFRALRNFLHCNPGDASGEIQMLASGFGSSDIRVYDVSDSLNPIRLTLDPSHILPSGGQFTVEFQDSVAAGAPRRYIVTWPFRVPPPASFSAVNPLFRGQLTARSAGDYLLVVPEAFLGAVDPLVQLRQSQGLNVVVAPFQSVCDEFNGGRKSSYAIKRFVRHAFDNWNAKFVLLAGDGSEDPQNFSRESSPDWIPIQKINGPVVIQFGYEIVPSDPWYVCLNNCDLGGFVPVLQDLFIGRLPVGTLQQAQEVIAKLVDYESFAADQTWRNQFLLCSDDDYSGVTFFGGGGGGVEYCRRPGERVFEQINETVADVIANQGGLAAAVLDTFNLGDLLAGVACVDPVPSDSDTCPCRDLVATQQITHASITQPELIARLNAGRMWWNFQGHANEFVLTHEDLYVNRGFQDDKDLLMNDGKPFLFSAFSCHANAFARYGDLATGRGPSLGEEMVTLPVRGAVASWASSGYEILPFSGVSHINVAWARAMFESPPHDPYLGQPGARAVLGETIALALLRYVPTVTFNPNEKGIALTYQLLGDPATQLSIGEPQAIVTANQLPVTDSQPVRLHTAGDTLRLEADLVSNVALTELSLELTDGSGTQTVPAADYTLTPAFPDSAGRRYHLSYGTTLRPDSYRYTFRTKDRYGVPGDFDVVFQFFTQLRLDDVPIADGDPVPPAANLAMRVLSPRPLVPLADLTMTVNGAAQAFTATPVAGDGSGREWTLSWTHPPYPIDNYEVRLSVNGGGVHTRRFRVVVGGSELKFESMVAFPNPFDDEVGTVFSFLLIAGGPSDLQIRVFTPSGRLVYERLERGLAPGYHQIPWNGRDAENDKLANGVYLYRVLASNGSSKTEHLGRLVKLRKPRRGSSP